MKDVTTYVGIDAHKKDLFIAMLVGTQATPVTWTVANEPHAIRRLVRKLEREAPGPVRSCYEAGPCGYALQRRMTTTRVVCQVIAPALIPRKPGERIKTNPRDARKLAELLRAGLLTPALLARFRREAAVLSRLDHPGIARFVETGLLEAPGGLQPYFAMELVDGADLRAWAAHPRTEEERLELGLGQFRGRLGGLGRGRSRTRPGRAARVRANLR